MSVRQWLSLPILAVVVCGANTGCGKKGPSAPPVVVSKDKPAPPKVEPDPVTPATRVDDTGTVRFEFDIPLDPKAIITIGGNDYGTKELEQPVALEAGTHSVAVKQKDWNVEAQEFTVEQGKRKIVRVHDPERRAAEWALSVDGAIDVLVGGKQSDVIRKLAELPKDRFVVNTINLERCQKLTDDGFASLQGSQLRSLRLNHTAVSNDGLAHLKGCRELADLGVYETKVTSAGLAHLQPLVKLRRLSIGPRELAGPSVANLTKLVGLEAINMAATPITDADLASLGEHLKGCARLMHFNLDNTAITGVGFKGLRGHPTLREVGLFRGGKVTDEGLQQVAGLPELWLLELAGNKQVTDAGLKHLGAHPKLGRLGLDATSVTDTGLAHLHSIKNLILVNLRETKVTDAGIEALRKVHPKIEIVR